MNSTLYQVTGDRCQVTGTTGGINKPLFHDNQAPCVVDNFQF